MGLNFVPDAVQTNEHLPPLDEQVIAQLLSGSLPDDERMAVLAQLAANPDARELLMMAMEALRAAEESNDKRAA